MNVEVYQHLRDPVPAHLHSRLMMVRKDSGSSTCPLFLSPCSWASSSIVIDGPRKIVSVPGPDFRIISQSRFHYCPRPVGHCRYRVVSRYLVQGMAVFEWVTVTATHQLGADGNAMLMAREGTGRGRVMKGIEIGRSILISNDQRGPSLRSKDASCISCLTGEASILQKQGNDN